CLSLSQPSHHMTITVTLKDEDHQKTLLRKGTNSGFYKCYLFMVPSVRKSEVQKVEVVVRSHTFNSKEIKKVLIKVLNPRTFIQTDKPIYNSGQKVQRSYLLDPDALEGFYRIIVKTRGERFYHSFKVQKYGLPQFDIKVIISKEVSVGQKTFDVRICAKHKHGRPVNGDVTVRVCRPPKNYHACTPPHIHEDSKEIGPTSLCNTKHKEVKAVDYDSKPVPHLHLYLLLGGKGYNLKTITADEHGMASFELNTETFNGDVLLHVSEKYQTPTLEYPTHGTSYYEPASLRVHKSGPGPSTSGYLRIRPYSRPLRCGEVEKITIEYRLKQQHHNPSYVRYLVSCFQLSFNFIYFDPHPDFAPYIQVVAYIVLSCDNVLAHSAKFNTEKCLKNTVTRLSPSRAVPGEEVKLCVKTHPMSMCGVSLVDVNVLQKAPGKILDEDKIFDLLPMKKTNSVPPEVQDRSECVKVRPKRDAALALTNQEKEDAYSVFKVKSTFINAPCLRLQGKKYEEDEDNKPGKNDLEFLPDPGNIPYICSDTKPGEPVHSLSTETWIFDLVEVGERGATCVPYTTPDTITTWEAEVFCLAPHSFGLAPRFLFRVVQPLSLDFHLPYSIIKEESFILKATVFNHLPRSIMVKVTPAVSSYYTLTLLSDDQVTFCLCARKYRNIRWTLTPSSLGVVDVTLTAEAVRSSTHCCDEEVRVPERGRTATETQTLVVKDVGAEIIRTQSWLVCPKGQHLRKKVHLPMPSDAIDGSSRTEVSVSGDVFSQRLKNLDSLLRLPYGCGEQNIAIMLLMYYICVCLIVCFTLTLCFLFCFMFFFLRLTAFVMATLYNAQAFIYIDPKVIEESRKWLECQQIKSGCFKMSGKFFNDRIRGEVSDEVTLTAYVTAAFLETNISNPVVKKSLCCLRKSAEGISNTYTTALLAYVFTLAGDMDMRAKLFQQLDSLAMRKGDLIYWCQSAEKSSPMCVETTSYVLLAKLRGSLSGNDLTSALSIAKWLIEQQSSQGGFFSTQDSAVAIKALALFATSMSSEGSTWVTVTSPNDHQTFHVNPENKLLYQELLLQDMKGKYLLKAKGHACAVVQVSDWNYQRMSNLLIITFICDLFYVMLQLKHELRSSASTFKISKTEDGSCTNMVIVDIEIPSGFLPVPESLGNSGVLVKNVEYKNGHVILYLWELHKDIPVFHELQLVLEHVVLHLKPSTVIIYDYYNPSKLQHKAHTAVHHFIT
uniref:Uncharacterized protein n=1 Tax=Nothobranchius furzeri TaxID=105023 RepID=A0A8C6PD03_NOTFU